MKKTLTYSLVLAAWLRFYQRVLGPEELVPQINPEEDTIITDTERSKFSRLARKSPRSSIILKEWRTA
jgi:hypothetical protein